MKSIPNLSEKVKGLFSKIKVKKNAEIVIAAILALIAIVAYFAIGAAGRTKSASTGGKISAEMTDEEKRISAMISEIDGIGSARVYISYDDKKVSGVVVVAKGADKTDKKVQIVRLLEIATGASVDQIQIFQKANGG